MAPAVDTCEAGSRSWVGGRHDAHAVGHAIPEASVRLLHRCPALMPMMCLQGRLDFAVRPNSTRPRRDDTGNCLAAMAMTFVQVYPAITVFNLLLLAVTLHS